MIPDPVDIVYCEVCELPHRRGVAVCEQCRHALGSVPNWERLRAELPDLRNKVLVGVGATLLMIIGTGWLFGGAGYIGVGSESVRSRFGLGFRMPTWIRSRT